CTFCTFSYSSAILDILSPSSFPTRRSSDFEWIFVIVIAIAAFAILFAKSRITAILLNSVIGFSVAFFFVLFRAPDLALTQTIIRSEEHTSELQSRFDLVCRLLLGNKKRALL